MNNKVNLKKKTKINDISRTFSRVLRQMDRYTTVVPSKHLKSSKNLTGHWMKDSNTKNNFNSTKNIK